MGPTSPARSPLRTELPLRALRAEHDHLRLILRVLTTVQRTPASSIVVGGPTALAAQWLGGAVHRPRHDATPSTMRLASSPPSPSSNPPAATVAGPVTAYSPPCAAYTSIASLTTWRASAADGSR